MITTLASSYWPLWIRIPAYVEAGADIITLHVESSRYIHRALQVLETMTRLRITKNKSAKRP